MIASLGAIWVVAYRKWHARSLQLLQQPDHEPDEAFPRVLLAQCYGRLGNQVRTVLSSFLFAVLTERVLLVESCNQLAGFEPPFNWSLPFPPALANASQGDVNLLHYAPSSSWKWLTCADYNEHQKVRALLSRKPVLELACARGTLGFCQPFAPFGCQACRRRHIFDAQAHVPPHGAGDDGAKGGAAWMAMAQ